MNDPRVAIFISGRGSNMAAACDINHRHFKIVAVFSSTEKASGVVRARRSGIPTFLLSKPVDWKAVDSQLRSLRVDRIFLAGFMRLLPGEFVSAWEDKILNVHPSLLPAYPGLHSVENAWNDKKPLGVTVHKVIEEMDAGPILRQAPVSCDDDSLENTFRLVHAREHQLVREVMARWSM